MGTLQTVWAFHVANLSLHMRVSQNQVYLIGGPHGKDNYSILETTVRVPQIMETPTWAGFPSLGRTRVDP